MPGFVRDEHDAIAMATRDPRVKWASTALHTSRLLVRTRSKDQDDREGSRFPAINQNKKTIYNRRSTWLDRDWLVPDVPINFTNARNYHVSDRSP